MCLLLRDMQLFISQDVKWWTGVVWITCGLLWWFYQLFGLSFWRHPFTSEDPLVSKWCKATFIQSVLMKKTYFILDGLSVSKFSAVVHFWVNYSFKHDRLISGLSRLLLEKHHDYVSRSSKLISCLSGLTVDC